MLFVFLHPLPRKDTAGIIVLAREILPARWVYALLLRKFYAGEIREPETHSEITFPAVSREIN